MGSRWNTILVEKEKIDGNDAANSNDKHAALRGVPIPTTLNMLYYEVYLFQRQ